ncbi:MULTISPECIES: beta-N-acetylhexosaminidase [Sporosarcina]|uniref:beta-N-acetylhexosaminidase n=1 Tax=Sporosarcina TaxID=1569 RepID=UPI00164D39B2|nr:beta-N-acetylhexosaminidase [Sporosarcina sp. resist]QNK89570.1 beta-N-acetylhexosaminidase [Sporosarcina sp. resist]
MNRNYKFIFLVVCCTLLMSGCSQFTQKNKDKETDVTNSPITEPPKKEEIVLSKVEEMVDQMTLEEKVGQLLVIGVEGTSFSSEMDNLIRNYHVGGVIIMGRNVATTNEMLQLINGIKKANELNKIPLFLSVDEEGGRVSRMPVGIPKLPTSAQIGKLNDESVSYRAGTYLAGVLNEFGYNMNFAPVLDVNSNPRNPVIGNRSFGSDPYQVAKLGISTMHGMMDNGIIPVVKHFPGHGDTVVDSHKALPKVETTLEALRNVELVPFQKAIEEGADAVMVAHILFPALDPDYPSSMSKAIITGLLRNEMKFEGVIITDDLTMGAIANDYTIPEAAVQSFIAGSDQLLVVRDYEVQLNTLNAFIKAIETGEITEERLNESVKRILTLKEKYSVSDEVHEKVDMDKINELYDKLQLK